MNEAIILDLSRESIFVMLKISAPPLLTALAVGLAISLFQALTQIQEMTLTFVPKIVAIFLSLTLFLPFMIATLSDFTRAALDHAVGGG